MHHAKHALLTGPAALLLLITMGLAACGLQTDAEEEAALDKTETSLAETTPEPAIEPAPKPVAKAAAKPSAEGAQFAAAESQSKPVCADCGTISSIEKKTEEGEGTGVGAVTGAVIGGVAGREIVKGDRDKRNIAGVLGAVAGGYAGHKIEEKARSTDFYKVSVKMDSDGRIEVVRVGSAEGLSVGQQVRVVDGNIVIP